jgi:uncharacterized membrane protein
MKRLIHKYEMLCARQFMYSALTVVSLVVSVLLWIACGDYGMGKLFVLTVCTPLCLALVVWVGYLSVKKKIALRAIVRGLTRR